MPRSRVRVGGSGFTTFHWRNNLIGWAENVTVNPVQPVAQPVAIQPLNAQRPIEIITPGAHANGTITLTLTELYNQSVWQRLSDLTGSNDIVDIMRTIAAIDQGITLTKIIRPGAFNTTNDDPTTFKHETFFNVVVASVEDQGETIDVRTMELNKQMTLWYTHSLKSWINRGSYQWVRDTRTGFNG